jgi:hypothetical protein
MIAPMLHTRRPGGVRPWPAALLTVLLLAGWLPLAHGETESLLDRMSNKRMQAFEERLTGQINGALGRYISAKQYVLSVKVIWNQNVIPAVQDPELAPTRQKLPGLPIFVRSPEAPQTEDGTPQFTRMVVQVLLDETLPEYYERFVRKLVPIVARFDARRGDQVVVLKETFPALPEGEQPPTLPEKELMQQLGETPEQRFPPTGTPQPPVQLTVGMRQGMSPVQAAQLAYDEGRYTDALRIVQSGFQQATTNTERARYLGMEGSVLYTMNNQEGARAAWQRAVVFDPGNMEIHRALTFLQESAGGGQQ